MDRPEYGCFDDDDPDAPWNQPCDATFLDLNDY